MNTLLTAKKAFHIFGCDSESISKEQRANLPAFAKRADGRTSKSWSNKELPELGREIGFLKKSAAPLAVSVFVTKGGVLKSTLSLNFARMAALHGIRTCVVGLDMQGDITTALESVDDEPASTEDSELAVAMAKIDEVRGLSELFTRNAELKDLICQTDLATLHYIPETPELVALDQGLINRNRREFWLKDFVVDPLKKEFDLIVLDCSPNWNRLITNALVATDFLLSPVECKINNFRNLKTFRILIAEFRREMELTFEQIFIPTRLAMSRKLSADIFAWYQKNLLECSVTPVRESMVGEEATAVKLSLPEYAPTSPAAQEMRQLIGEIWQKMEAVSRTNQPVGRSTGHPTDQFTDQITTLNR